jgi:hypothetical protein
MLYVYPTLHPISTEVPAEDILPSILSPQMKKSKALKAPVPTTRCEGDSTKIPGVLRLLIWNQMYYIIGVYIYIYIEVYICITYIVNYS